MPSGLINVAKQVLRAAVKLGVEEAGSRICGAAWPALKQILTPVAAELEKRYPNMFLVEAEMEKAQADLSNDPALAEQLRDALTAIQHGQREIITLLARHDETLEGYRDLIIRAVGEAEGKNQARHDVLLAEFAAVNAKLDGLPDQVNKALLLPGLSIAEIYKKANGYQADAMTWIIKGDPSEAEQRLGLARSIAMSGLAQNPKSALMMVTLGFIEKSQAQVSELRRDPEATTGKLALAAKYFARAIELDKTNINALHGMANIYYFSRDHDSAIQLEYAVVSADPTHGPALNDLGLALEMKLRATADPVERATCAEALLEVYARLEAVMPTQPEIFPATYLAHVQRRSAELKKAFDLGPE